MDFVQNTTILMKSLGFRGSITASRKIRQVGKTVVMVFKMIRGGGSVISPA